jgi:hypothetical protein
MLQKTRTNGRGSGLPNKLKNNHTGSIGRGSLALLGQAVTEIKEKIGKKRQGELRQNKGGNQGHYTGKRDKNKENREKENIHTVLVFMNSGCRSIKEGLEDIVRKSGFFLSFQWPKKWLVFVNRLI